MADRQIQLSSGRFTMIAGGLGFSFVLWRPALEQHVGCHTFRRRASGRRHRLELWTQARAL
ncbi:DUF3363 domain-containing protein [Bradyrhizobium sp. SZCCHNR2020]|uniref:DUF3363 domain-containing protein n=1 Tax=unclassified Bradyrhizobium TaxID=2631580 RepID=UPI0039671FA9